MIFSSFRVALLVLLFWPSFAGAQSADFLPLSMVKAGMVGEGKTVFQGTQVDTFAVEILGVLENMGPKRSLILARLSGDKLERTGVFAGMSGSPVYIDNRLIGAIAYAFPFAKEPIAGITPIEEMVDIFKEGTPASNTRLARNVNPHQLYEVSSLSDLFGSWDPAHLQGELPGGAFGTFGRFQPIATPLNLGGFTTETVRAFSSQFDRLGLVPVFGAGSGRLNDLSNAPLQAGSTVGVQLIRGDMNINASGTVTHISGDKIYAFGHPFLSMGYTDMPLTSAGVLTVIPSMMNSQKLSATGDIIGSIRQDRATGIMGIKGAQPKMIPVNVRLRTSRHEDKEYRYEIVSDNFLTPFLMTFTVHNSITASERSIGGQTLQVKCTISLKDQPKVRFENSVSDMASSPALAAITAASPINFLLNSGFENVVMEGIDLEIKAVENTQEALLDKVWQDRIKVRPGEEIGITVFLRKPNGEVISNRYPVKIPEDIPAGPLKILIGDGISVSRHDAHLDAGEFIPENLAQLVKAINNLKKNDRFYIRLFREQEGAVIGGHGLPNLPPSLLSLYKSQKTSGDARLINRVVYVEHELPSTDYVLSGEKVIQVDVEG